MPTRPWHVSAPLKVESFFSGESISPSTFDFDIHTEREWPQRPPINSNDLPTGRRHDNPLIFTCSQPLEGYLSGKEMPLDGNGVVNFECEFPFFHADIFNRSQQFFLAVRILLLAGASEEFNLHSIFSMSSMKTLTIFFNTM